MIYVCGSREGWTWLNADARKVYHPHDTPTKLNARHRSRNQSCYYFWPSVMVCVIIPANREHLSYQKLAAQDRVSHYEFQAFTQYKKRHATALEPRTLPAA